MPFIIVGANIALVTRAGSIFLRCMHFRRCAKHKKKLPNTNIYIWRVDLSLPRPLLVRTFLLFSSPRGFSFGSSASIASSVSACASFVSFASTICSSCSITLTVFRRLACPALSLRSYAAIRLCSAFDGRSLASSCSSVSRAASSIMLASYFLLICRYSFCVSLIV